DLLELAGVVEVVDAQEQQRLPPAQEAEERVLDDLLGMLGGIGAPEAREQRLARLHEDRPPLLGGVRGRAALGHVGHGPARGPPGARPSSTPTMRSAKRAPAVTTWAITSLALHSPAAGRSANRAAGTAVTLSRTWPMAWRTRSINSGGESLAPWACR